jgi:hypothetical protein
MNSLSDHQIIVLGQHVQCSLGWAGFGIVVAIHGEQSPQTVGTIGGVVAYGGRATFDVAFASGHLSKHVPEAIIRGIQWKILEGVADTDEIIDAVQACRVAEARRRETEEAHTARRIDERQQHAADNPHLLKKSDRPDWSPGRLAAENMRRELKKRFPATTFRITSDYNSVNVHWTNGPSSKAVEAICERHKAGNFDGMTDSYNYDADATFGDVFGDPEYVFCNRHHTIAALRAAWAAAGHNADDIPAEWEKGIDYNHPLRHHVMEAWRVADLTGIVAEPVKEPKPQGPFWSKRGLLAIDSGGYSREFRKVETAQAEVDRLTALGFKVELVHGFRRGQIFIRKLDA